MQKQFESDWGTECGSPANEKTVKKALTVEVDRKPYVRVLNQVGYEYVYMFPTGNYFITPKGDRYDYKMKSRGNYRKPWRESNVLFKRYFNRHGSLSPLNSSLSCDKSFEAGGGSNNLSTFNSNQDGLEDSSDDRSSSTDSIMKDEFCENNLQGLLKYQSDKNKFKSIKNKKTNILHPKHKEVNPKSNNNLNDVLINETDKSKYLEALFKQDVIKFKSKQFNNKNDILIKIEIQCIHCNQNNHKSNECPLNQKLCIRCKSTSHDILDCNVIQCLRCNKLGHLACNCPAKSNIKKCRNCRQIGHVGIDCLRSPTAIPRKVLKESYCFFCKKKGHYICPFKHEFINIEDYYSDDVIISDTENDYCNPLFEQNKGHIRIKNQINCPKCTGPHSVKSCDGNICFNSRDKVREILANKFFQHGKSKLAQDKNFMDESFSDCDNSIDNSSPNGNKDSQVNISITTKGKVNSNISINLSFDNRDK
jgi:hypothetical protein